MAYRTIPGEWHHAQPVVTKSRWVCGYCSQETQSPVGYAAHPQAGAPSGPPTNIRICGNCNAPSLFQRDYQSPAPAPGAGDIANCPPDLTDLFEQARRALGANAATACVLACRKIIHHIAVDRRGADQGKFPNFKAAVEFLNENRYLPPGGEAWVHYVRDRANEENHEINLTGPKDAEGLLMLTRHLLVHIYDLPSRVPASPPRSPE